jgi:Glucose-6-phosphate dehydrogenase, NAD binding domain
MRLVVAAAVTVYRVCARGWRPTGRMGIWPQRACIAAVACVSGARRCLISGSPRPLRERPDDPPAGHFQATGDLTARYLLPALAALRAAGDLPGDFRRTCAGREKWNGPEYQDWAAAQLGRHAASLPPSARQDVVAASGYAKVNVTDPAAVAARTHRRDRATRRVTTPTPARPTPTDAHVDTVGDLAESRACAGTYKDAECIDAHGLRAEHFALWVGRAVTSA